MNRLSSLVVSTLVALSCSLALGDEPSPAAAVPPTEAQVAARAVLQRELLTPLAAKERSHSRLSRARLPPSARRARIVDTSPRKDATGAAFVAFAIDDQHGFADLDEADPEAGWRKDVITGCVYLEQGTVFVRSGAGYRPGSLLLGKPGKVADASVCRDGSSPVANAGW